MEKVEYFFLSDLYFINPIINPLVTMLVKVNIYYDQGVEELSILNSSINEMLGDSAGYQILHTMRQKKKFKKQHPKFITN